MKLPRGLLAAMPVVFFGGIALLFVYGLQGDPAKLPSTLINKQVPQFELPAIERSSLSGLASADLARGEVTVVNVFASWCAPCRDEHPFLMQLAKTGTAVVGINYKDDPANALNFLAALGNPYSRAGADREGRAAVDWGVYGVPETFIVDGRGVIRRKFIGPITPEILQQGILPAIAAAAAN